MARPPDTIGLVTPYLLRGDIEYGGTLRIETTAPTRDLRPDIQGLRAIAVLAVVADHLMAWPRGGFVGVDIFFVISGFLITGQLVRAKERNPGRPYLRTFYVNRIRRILPAATLALVVTVGVAWFLFRRDRAWSTTIDGMWSALSVGNWRFALDGTDYWAQDQAISPLQHFWSLGVEEQFYLVWPLIILAGFAVFKNRRALGWIMGAIILGSFVWAVYETATNGTVAYFSTLSRAWELGVGALLAIIGPVFRQMTVQARTVLAWAGLAGIVCSVAFITPEMPFPGPWAAAPVLATAMVIAAGTGGRGLYLVPLTNPVMTHIGNLSFSLYLWHFPVIIFLEEFIKEWHWTHYPLVFGIMLMPTLVSYHFLEEPVRRSQFLLPKSHGKKQPLFTFGPAAQNMALSALAVTVLGGVASTFVGPPSAVATLPQPLPSVQSTSAPSPDKPAVSALQNSISAALATTSWPTLSPSIDDVASQGSLDERGEGCATPTIDEATCNFQTGKSKTAVVFSDSTGVALISTLRDAIGDEYNVRGFSMASCVSLDLTIKDERPGHVADCARYKAEATSIINETQPDLVFITNTTGVMGDVEVAGDGLSGIQAWEAATARTVEALKPSGAQIVLTTSAPIGKTISKCATRTSVPADCVVTLEDGYLAQWKSMSATSGVKAIDTRSLFCDGRGVCPAFIDGMSVKTDTVHVTEQYSKHMAPAFRELFKASMS